MPKFTVVVFETFRSEWIVEAKDADDARAKYDELDELPEDTRDPHYYDAEVLEPTLFTEQS